MWTSPLPLSTWCPSSRESGPLIGPPGDGSKHVKKFGRAVVSPGARQTSHRLLCEMLRRVLADGVGAGTGGVGSIEVRAVAALYGLLMDHPVDRRGRCRSCRRQGEVLGLRRRRCRVHRAAHFYLYHPDAFLLSHLAGELGLPAPSGSDPDDTEVLPVVVTDPDGPRTTAQSPVVSPPPFLPGGFPRAGRPDPEHGEVAQRPERPRPRRAPFTAPDEPEPPASGGLSLLGRGAA